ncbi:MAG: CBS domain-containing protein [bacterium]
MREQGVRHLPVVDENRRLVGFITDRDIRRPDWVDEAIDVAHAYRLDDDLEVADLMTTNVISVQASDPLKKAVDIFLDRRYGALPVQDKNGDLVGILSALDLVQALSDLLPMAAEE